MCGISARSVKRFTVEARSRPKSTVLTVDSVAGWAVGSGIGIANAGVLIVLPNVDLAPPTTAALVTRVTAVDEINSVLHLRDAAAHTVTDVAVTSDDSLPIQDAIDVLGENGGTVCLPPGTYMIGTPGTTTNKPLVLGSNLRLIGAGKGATILQLCKEVNMYLRGKINPNPNAGPIIVNASNFDWFYNEHEESTEEVSLPYYGLPYDCNIEIAGITLDGGKNHQSVLLYEPDYRPNPTQMPAPTNSVFLRSEQNALGKLSAGTDTVHQVFVRFQDAAGNEGIGAMARDSINLAPPNNALVVSLPPVFPTGAVWVVPYIRRADAVSSANPVVEVDILNYGNGNWRYERLAPVLLSSITTPWNGNPDPSNWPTIPIYEHTVHDNPPAPAPVEIDTQGFYHFPGLVSFYGNSTARSYGIYLLNAEKLYIHDVEIRNVATDGIDLQNVNYSKFDRIHVHHNARNGICIVNRQMEEVDFNDCVLESNGRYGLSLGDGACFCKSMRWNRCSFINNNRGVALAPGDSLTLVCQDLEFNKCLFDGNGDHFLTGSGTVNIVNLKIKDCRFRNNAYGTCIYIQANQANSDYQIITGEITGCDFDQANGHGGTPSSENSWSFAPGYNTAAGDEPALLLSGANTVFRITNNHFKPWAASQTWTDLSGVQHVQQFCSSAYMIDISGTAGGHTIQNNHFESNPQDIRTPLIPGPGVLWSTTIKNQHFIWSGYEPNQGFAQLRSNKISGNIGDGLLWTGYKINNILTQFQCRPDLEETGIVTATNLSATTLSSVVSFLDALPSNYLVTAAFNWNAGAWWVTNVTAYGFTLNWDTGPGASASPQIIWSAKFALA